MNYDEAIRSLQDTAVVMAEIQRRQSDVQKPKRDCSRASSNSGNKLKKNLAHATVRLAEITDKLALLQGHVA